MQVDRQTLHDLGILSPDGGQASIFDWANFTRTQGGARALRERFCRPMADAGEIREVQAAVAWLGHHASLFDLVLSNGVWLSLERYASSSFTPLDHPNGLILWLDSWSLPLLHRDVYREVLASLALTQMLTRSAGELLERMDAREPPPLLRRWQEQVRECLESPPLARLRQGRDVHRARPPWILARDRALRLSSFEELARLARLVYEIDALRSLAIATRERDLVLPEVTTGEEPAVEAVDLYHPLLERPAGNPLLIGEDSRLVYLTGPNMSGKSTYLKAAGIAVLLAQMGMGVPAKRLRCSPFECLFSGIDTTDNLRLGQSYFFREVSRVREIAERLADGVSAFVIFDEMFKGTNLKDASDATLAVLTGFSASTRSAFLVASHITELAGPVSTLPGARLFHFGANLHPGAGATFEYRLRPGVSDQRIGMLVLEREGVLEHLRRMQG